MRNLSILMATIAIAGFSACNHHAEKASSDGTLSSGPDGTYIEKEVYRDSNVVFRQIDEHTWEGRSEEHTSELQSH